MFWVGVKFTDGTGVHHVFSSCQFYVVGARLHVHGQAICGVSFSLDRSGSRVDVTDGIASGMEDDIDHIAVPLDCCIACLRRSYPLPVAVDEGN